MKILAIRGQNLASLEGNFEIDFTIEPLKSAGIFAITGKTGSGKSTILDAICLALFNATPRARQAPKREKANDDTMLIGSDTRNILRRGTGDGFAEIDFMALNGDKYRSTWRVQRAHKNPSGKFQTETQRLFNLTTGVEEPLSKKDFPSRINELIGLTFDQFTRAVLLAQGDFSTFLKASEDEKAELLEKLTGTDVYSKISVEIHSKSKEVKEEYELIKQQIGHIKLLTEAEINELDIRKEEIDNELKDIRKKIETTDQNLNWLDTQHKYILSIENVKQELEAVNQRVLQSTQKIEYIKLIDLSFQIRNEFLDLKIKNNQWNEYQKRLIEFETSLQKNSAEITACNQQLKLNTTKQEKTEKELKEIAPVLEQIIALEIQIEAEAKTIHSAENEWKRETEKRSKSEEKMKDFEALLKTETAALQTINDWFTKNEVFKEIIPRIDILIGHLNNSSLYQKKKEKTEKEKHELMKALEILNTSLQNKEQEEIRLNEILPAEVVHLRKKLVRGEACPVCGSKEHPYTGIQSSDISELNEKSLETQKEQIKTEIGELKNQIHQKEVSIIEKDTLIIHYNHQYNLSTTLSEEFLILIPEWKEQFQEENVQNRLTLLASEWNNKLQLLNTKNKLIDAISINLENEKLNFSSIHTEWEHKQHIYQSLLKRNEEFIEKRNELSQGKDLKHIHEQLKKEKETLIRIYQQIKEETDLRLNQKSKLEGGIGQIRHDMDLLQKEKEELRILIDNWLNQPGQCISEELLENLTSQSLEWINSEKDFLNNLHKNQISITATLKEREEQLSLHLNSSHKIDDAITAGELSQYRNEAKQKEASLLEAFTEIQVIFSRNQQDQETLGKYRKLLTEKEETMENWQKLNYLLGSHDGSKFKRIAQSYTLEILLSYANKHLEQLNKRYCLLQVPNSLALQVIDKDMLDEVRTVHSLSGGEAFLISLALALGLSSLSSQRMNIESLFIDEGFGSLDTDTLTMAMDALERLQTQGRKIGVISHVAEMTERIPVRIQLIKENNGKSRLSVKK